MNEVSVQSFESFKGPFYRGEAPKQVVLIITHAGTKGRIRLFGVNVHHGHVGFALEAAATEKQAIEQRLASELAESGGSIGITWDGSLVSQGVVGPGPAPGPGPIGIPDVLQFARNLVAQSRLDSAGQVALGEWLSTRGV